MVGSRLDDRACARPRAPANRAFRPARRRRWDHRRRHRRGRDAARVQRRPRRARRLRLGNVERVVETDPRRAALSPARPLQPPPRGSGGGAGAQPLRRASPRPPAQLRAAGLPGRPVRADPDPRRALVVRGPDGRRLRARPHDRAGGGLGARPVAAARRPPGRGSLSGCPDRRCAALPRQPARRRRRRRCRAQRRRAGRSRARAGRAGARHALRRDGGGPQPRRGERRRAVDRRGPAAGGCAGGHVGDPEQRSAPRARAQRWLGRCADDPDRPDSRRVRGSLGGDAPARDDGLRLRGRCRRDRADRGRGAADPRRGRARPRARCARQRAWALRRRAGPAGASGSDGARASRDDAVHRPARNGLGRRREADDVPSHRAGRAARAPRRARPAPDRPPAAPVAGRRRPRRRSRRSAPAAPRARPAARRSSRRHVRHARRAR